jgi:hypothetical protein
VFSNIWVFKDWCRASAHRPTYNPIGDFKMINNASLREVFAKGPKYRESKSINWKHNFKILMRIKWNKLYGIFTLNDIFVDILVYIFVYIIKSRRNLKYWYIFPVQEDGRKSSIEMTMSE